jgi:hypothetical protein
MPGCQDCGLFVTGKLPAVSGAKFLVAIPAPVLPQAREKIAQAFKALLLPDHQPCRSASWTFHAGYIGPGGAEL